MALDEIAAMPGFELTAEMLSAVDRTEQYVPGLMGAPEVRVLTYRPKISADAPPLIVSLHGGAFGMRADMFPVSDARLARLGAFVVSVDYRGVPEHPFPAGPEDSYAALCWAAGLRDIATDRIVVTGVSAGGALAAAVTLMARDRQGPSIAFQALRIPVLDDRCRTPSMRQYVTAPLFGANEAVSMWDNYLGESTDRGITSPYAAPSRASDLSGLPPAFIQVNGLDPLRDEGIQYAMALMAADVPVEIYCGPHQHHGMSQDPRTEAQATRLYEEAILAVLS